MVSSNLSVSELNVGHLGSGLYYWKVVVEDDKGARVEGPVWSFRVREENHPPSIPHDPNPEDGSVVSPISVELRWSCEDPDGDELEYDLYFGKDPEPDLLVSGLRSSSYHVGDLEHGTRYYWKVVARDGKGGIAVGPVWSFTTEPKLEEISRIHLFDGGTGEALVVGDSYSRIAYVVRYDPGRLYVVDLENEYSPHVVSSVDLGCRVTGMDYGGYLYVLCSSGLEIFDVSNPSDPVLKSSVELDVSYTEDINVGVERIYISGSDFLVLDRTYPTAPWEVSSLDESGGDIEVSGDRVYMEVYRGFEILDVSDPHDPRVLVYEYTGGSGDLEISGSRLYMDTGSQISVYDVENLDSIHGMGGYYLGSAVWDLKLYWDYVVACTYDGVYVLNFDDPSNPHLLLLYSDPTGYPVSSDVWSDRIYALYSNGDLVVLDSSALWRMVLSTRF